MWILLKKDISSEFNIETGETFLLKIDKTNFLVGRNNSGKSYFLRFLLTNAVKIYDSNEEVIEVLKKIIQKEGNIDFEFWSKVNNDKIKSIYEEYVNYYFLLKYAYTQKIETNASYYNGIKVYNFNDDVINELKPLLNYLNLTETRDILNLKIIAKYKEVEMKIYTDFKDKIVKILDFLEDDDIIKFGSKLGNIENNEQIAKYYFPILRNIRHPLKKTQGLYDENTKIDIYKERIISEYEFDDEINIITGLNFYQDYKNNLLGSKEKREKINRFEKFLSEYFFNGDSVSIIPDEKTFELKININDASDKFIYQVGDGITSLLIIMYTVFMESDNNNRLFYIEEPENSFHPGFQRLFINMITYFKEFKNSIFIIATHSNHLIDIANRENKNCLIYLCKKENDKIFISEKNEEYYDVIDELGVNATSVLIANKAIWVEGKYDAFYIRLLLNLKNINEVDSKKFMEDYDYCFIPYGGKNMSLIDFNLTLSEDNVNEFITKARKINPKYMVVLDDDNMFENKKDAKIKSYQKLVKQLKNKAYKLKVREIENIFPKEVVEMYIKQGIKEELVNDSTIQELDIRYDEYKNRKLGEYINEKLLKKFNKRKLKSITGREEGFKKNGFLYDKSKFYKCVVEWSKKTDFKYQEDVTDEAKDLINEIEKFINE